MNCRFWSIVSRTVPPLRAGSVTVRLAGLTLPQIVDRVRQAAVLAGQHVVVGGLDAGRAGAVGVHGADDVGAGRLPGVEPLGGGLKVDAGQGQVLDLLRQHRGLRGGEHRVLAGLREHRHDRRRVHAEHRGEPQRRSCRARPAGTCAGSTVMSCAPGGVGEQRPVAVEDLPPQRVQGDGVDPLRFGGAGIAAVVESLDLDEPAADTSSRVATAANP